MSAPGLVPYNLRQPGPQDAEQPDGTDIIVEMADDNVDVPDIDEKGNILKIEHGDGSVSISLDGHGLGQTVDAKPKDWFDNLVDDIDDGELGRISDELLRGIDDDLESRRDWVENRALGIKLLGLKVEVPGLQGASDGAPVEGMSKVRHPLLLEAVLRFQANARSELLPTDGPVKIRNDDNNAELKEDQLANALERDLNHFLTTTASEYYPDTDRMLLMLGFGGTSFKKIYYCPLRNRPVSETVDADDLIVNNAATDLRNAKRVTHRSFMRPSTVKRLQILGVYRDIELSVPNAPKLDTLQREEKATQGISVETGNPEDRDREIYECYCELDIKGFEHKHKGKDSGLEIPYRVTIDVSSRKILSITRNYDEDNQDLPDARTVFVKYTFVPGLGFYDIGLLHILGNTTNAITAAWRELLDAGMYSNFPGFLMADTGARQNTNIFRVPPGGGALVKTGGLPISQAIMPLPYQPPSQALMQLVSDMAQTGMRIGGTSEQQVGEGKAESPVGTTLAMIEQATKVMNAVHKRLHASQAEEFQLLVKCFQEHPEAFWQRKGKTAYPWDEQTFLTALQNCDLVPQADPNTASHGQRMMKVMALKQLQAANPNLYDAVAIDTAAMQAMGWNNPQQFFVPRSAATPPPPEVLKVMKELSIKEKVANADMMRAQADTAEVQAKIRQGAFAPKQDGLAGGQPQQDPMKMMDLQLRARELEDKQKEDVMEFLNRKRDRESKERIEAVKYAEEMARNPGGLGIAQSIIDPGMLQRLEQNEPETPGLPGDEG
jgi:hypothetical protein